VALERLVRRDDRDVGFGEIIRGEGQLHPETEVLREMGCQTTRQRLDHDGMRRLLRAHLDQLPPEQLDPIVLAEGILCDQDLELGSSEGTDTDL
jgi:hypothetical protein